MIAVLGQELLGPVAVEAEGVGEGQGPGARGGLDFGVDGGEIGAQGGGVGPGALAGVRQATAARPGVAVHVLGVACDVETAGGGQLGDLIPGEVGVFRVARRCGLLGVAVGADHGGHGAHVIFFEQRQGIGEDAQLAVVKGYEYGLFRQLAAARAVVEYLSDADGGAAVLRDIAQVALEDVGRDDVVPRPRRVDGDVMVHDDGQFPALICGGRRAYQKKCKEEADDSFHKITPKRVCAPERDECLPKSAGDAKFKCCFICCRMRTFYGASSTFRRLS